MRTLLLAASILVGPGMAQDFHTAECGPGTCGIPTEHEIKKVVDWCNHNIFGTECPEAITEPKPEHKSEGEATYTVKFGTSIVTASHYWKSLECRKELWGGECPNLDEGCEFWGEENEHGERESIQCFPKPLTTEWSYGALRGLLDAPDNMRFGFRSDGVVVWRKAEATGEK